MSDHRQPTAQAVRESLQRPNLSPAEVQTAFRSGSQVIRRLLASHPACTPKCLVELAQHFPAEVASNPALEVYALAEPTFLSSIPHKAVARILGEPESPETFLQWAAAQARSLERTIPGIRDLICLHPKASRELLDMARPSAVANLHVNSPVAWTLPWTSMFLAQRKTAHMTLPRLFHEGELPLIAALARHAMFRGDCPSIAAIICSTGRHACSTVLANHPTLSDDVASQLRRHSRGTAAPAQVSLSRASAGWSEVETAYLASRRPVAHLATFLMHTSDRLPPSLLVAAARRGNWRLRLAAAINPRLTPRAREGLATNDACWAVRAAVMECRTDVIARTPLRDAEIREESLPRQEKARLKTARAYLRARIPHVHPEAVRQIWEDRGISHFAIGGVLDDPSTPVPGAGSPILTYPPNWRRSQIVKMVAELNRSEREDPLRPA